MKLKVYHRDLIRAKALSQLGVQMARPQVIKKVKVPVNDKLLTILHVDDEPSAIELSKAALPESEYKVLGATSVSEAIDLLNRQTSISLVICDIIMPGKDGFELLDFLQTNIRFRNIPVIICSALANYKEVRRASSMGAAGYLAKPYSVALLLEKIQDALVSQKMTILLVSEEPIILNILKKNFERRHCRTILVGSCFEAMQSISEDNIEVVICDLVLVDGTGPDLLALIRDKHPKVPFFFLDDQTLNIEETVAISAGADGLLKRPLNFSEVLKKITNSFSK